MAKQTLTTRVSALETDVAEIKSDIKALLALAQANQPAAPVKAPKAPKAPKVAETACTCTPEKRCSVCFVEWMKETAPARAARKTSNADMAAWMRSKGLTPNGAAWEACKKGERSVKRLKALQG